MKTLKNTIKLLLTVFGIIVAGLFIVALLFIYQIRWRLYDVGTEKSPDGNYSLKFQSIGEADFPFGASHAKVTFYDGNKKIKSYKEDIYDDGAQFRKENYSVEWMPAGVIVTFIGSEQADDVIEIYYDDQENFDGYSYDEIEEILKNRYSIENIEWIEEKRDSLNIKADGVSFYARNNLAFKENYINNLFKTMTETYFSEGTNRGLSWETEKGDSIIDEVYIPVIAMESSSKQEISSYSEDICGWLRYCFEKLPYKKAKNIYSCFIPDIPGYTKRKYYFDPIVLGAIKEDDTAIYNGLYTYLDNYMAYKTPEQLMASESVDEIEVDLEENSDEIEIDDATLREWASYDREAVYDFADGSEYAMVGVDRALGSSFYVLLSFSDPSDQDTVTLVNKDPYNGSGGGSLFLTFIDDSDLGFSCLTFSGGSEGYLYRTDNRGKSFTEISIPSPKVKLSDGKFYNPFVMPEKVWREDGKVYLKVGQGPDGDYYSEELGGKAYGLYVSDNDGKTFEFLREEL
ncbi:hypothetical protein QYZ88_018380 (plasmid) [Lachnospiraceae bacterium C1.1]|nr:hypothetical protein [Lachnospiraceae bacterium C1.1]